MSNELPPLPEPSFTFVDIERAGTTRPAFTDKQMREYAALAASAERERCAKLCESLVDLDDDSCDEAERCAAAIRSGLPEEPA